VSIRSLIDLLGGGGGSNMSALQRRISPSSKSAQSVIIIGDEESLHLQQNKSSESLHRTNNRSNSFSNVRRDSSVSVVVSRVRTLLQNICVQSSYSKHDSNRVGGYREYIIRLLQDIVYGIILGSIGMCLLLLLDYYNIINLETGRVVRKTASLHIFNTPEFLEIIKEEMGDKELISLESYNTMTTELSDSEAVLQNESRILDIRTTKANTLKSELDTLRIEYDRLMKETGLDVFCEECTWGMGFNCRGRVNHMLENYSDTATQIECISKLVTQGQTNGKCIKKS